jgi:hypothetical protein
MPTLPKQLALRAVLLKETISCNHFVTANIFYQCSSTPDCRLMVDFFEFFVVFLITNPSQNNAPAVPPSSSGWI